MRTLLIAEQLRRSVPGGIGTYVRGLVRGLQEIGESPELWASRAPAAEDPLLALEARVHTSALPGPLMTRMWDRGLAGVPKDFDVVHATSLAVPRRCASPLTVMVHDLGWRHFPDAYPERGRRWHEKALDRVLAEASALVVPAETVANDLRDAGVDSERLTVIAEGSDHLPNPDNVSAQACLDRLGVSGRFALAVGTLEPRKNLPRLLSAFSQARSQLPEDVSLVVVGPVGWGSEIGPVEGVHLAGAQDLETIVALYSRCLLFVSVPLLEGYGLPVLEAMVSGAPVICSPVPSAGEAAYLVDPLDEEEIAAALILVANSETVQEELRTSGRRHAARLTWAECARAHLRIWEDLR